MRQNIYALVQLCLRSLDAKFEFHRIRKFDEETVRVDLDRIRAVLREYQVDSENDRYVLKKIYELGSILFCVGAPSEIWRAIVGRAALLQYEFGESAFLPWVIVGDLSFPIQKGRWIVHSIHEETVEIRCIYAILQGDSSLLPSLPLRDEYDRRFVAASASLLTQNLDLAVANIKYCVSYWLKEDPEWHSYHSGYYPLFHPGLSALARLFVHFGGNADAFHFREKLFLCAGISQ